MSSTDKSLAEIQGVQEDAIKKYSYLNPQYILRYEFTFKSMQWALILGIFFGLHTQIRHKDIRRSLNTFLLSSFGLIFPFWGFFYTKYNFYQSSIQRFEQEEFGKIKKFEMFKHMAEYKLKLPSNHDLQEQELMNRYEEYLKDYEYKNSQLDILLQNVNQKSYDLV